MTRDRLDINDQLAAALGLPSLERREVAEHVAQMAGLRAPTQQESEDLLVDVLLHAVRYINPNAAIQVFTWAEVANGGLQPLYDISRRDDSTDYLARCAIDLGLSETPGTPNDGPEKSELVQRLNAAVEDDVLGGIILRLRAAGIADMTAPG